MKKRSEQEFSQFILDGYGSSTAYPPEMDDLYFLYSFVRDKSIVSVLEIGSGWSTLALALAISENKDNFGSDYMKSVRHPNPFQVLSLDASSEWSSVALGRLPQDLREFVVPNVSTARIAEWGGAGGQVCSLFDNFPVFTADLIYLDGPNSDQVQGSVRGLQFEQPDSLPMHSFKLFSFHSFVVSWSFHVIFSATVRPHP